MGSDEKETAAARLLERFRKSWFPPAAVVGAVGAFAAALLRVRPEPGVQSVPAASPRNPFTVLQPVVYAAPEGGREYALTSVLGGADSTHPFRTSLPAIAIGPQDVLYALGDTEVRAFGPAAARVRSWKAPDSAACLAVAPDGRVFIGAADRVEVYEGTGARSGGFTAGAQGHPAAITAIKVYGKEVLVADAAGRLIRRYTMDGHPLGDIGSRTKTGSFILPNRSLDFDVGSDGTVVAGDSGRHRVTLWALDGSPRGAFGKFGMSHPEDFVGCCNPVNVAFAPDGTIVTAEKMVARVKVYEPGGKLLAVIGPEHFDPACTSIRLAVDSKGRIAAADPVRREIKMFTPVTQKQ